MSVILFFQAGIISGLAAVPDVSAGHTGRQSAQLRDENGNSSSSEYMGEDKIRFTVYFHQFLFSLLYGRTKPAIGNEMYGRGVSRPGIGRQHFRRGNPGTAGYVSQEYSGKSILRMSYVHYLHGHEHNVILV